MIFKEGKIKEEKQEYTEIVQASLKNNETTFRKYSI